MLRVPAAISHYPETAMQTFRIVLLSLWAATIQGMPYFILSSTRSKCLSLVAPQGQTLSISYKAPDMQVLPDEEGEEQENSAIDSEPSDGADADWNRRMKEKLERMKQKKMREMSITVTQKSGLASSSRERRTTEEKTIGQGRVREELKEREGTIEFRTGKDDGTVDICVQSITANRNSPSRVMLNVTMVMSDEFEDEENIIDENAGDALEHSELKSQMTRLERDLQTLNNRVLATLNNAEFNKDQEAEFHARSVRIGAAALYWPIIQITVIIVTGFTQANHIVKYMKAHHIGP